MPDSPKTRAARRFPAARLAASACTLGLLCGLPGAATAPASPPPEMAYLEGGGVPLPFRPPEGDSSRTQGTPRVGPFLLDTRAVTVAEYAAFLRKNPRYARSSLPRLLADDGYLRDWSPDGAPPDDTAGHPVTAVSWYAAKAFCADAGKRLPTTLEWEYAASTRPPGTEGDSSAQERLILAWYARSSSKDRAVTGSGSHHASGVRDLHGVIWEWTADYNAWTGAGINRRGRTDANEAAEAGLFCGGGAGGMRPGVPYATYMRWAFRASLKPEYTVGTLGFRCARDVAPEPGE